MKDFAERANRFARAVEARDGGGFAQLFTEDAVYHDAIYGAVHGRAAIAEMLVRDWYKDGDDWMWDMHDPVADGHRGYVRYTASFRSLNRFSEGQRIVARGVAMFRFTNGLFGSYDEIANGTPALWDLNVRGAHLERVVGRIADAQRASRSLRQHYLGART